MKRALRHPLAPWFIVVGVLLVIGLAETVTDYVTALVNLVL